MFPVDLAGPVGTLVAAVGMLWVVWQSVGRRRGSDRVDSRVGLFVVIVVLVAVVPLGLVAHGEPRFVFFPMWLLIAVGASVIVRGASELPNPYLAVAVAAAGLLWLPLFTETAGRVDRNAEARAETLSVVVDAGNHIENDGSGSCSILTTYQPQITWYSTCATELLRASDGSIGLELLEGDRRYVLVFDNGKRQPPDDVLDDYVDLSSGAEIKAANDRIGDASVIDVSSG